jgi:replicative DNA helicase
MPKLSPETANHAPDVQRLDLFDPPVPLDEYQPRPFPVTALPPWQADYVSAVAHATQTPLDLPGLLTLAATSTAMQKKVRVHIRPGYTEPVNIYVAIVMPPGSRKSPVFEETMRPIQAFEEALMREMAEEIARAETRYNIAKAELQHLQTKAAKETDRVERMRLDEEAADLAVTLLRLIPPEKPRVVTDDTTPERLASLLAANRGRMAVLSAEGGDVFAAMTGRYTAHQGRQGAHTGNFAPYLRGYSGDTLHVDRVGRPAEYVQQPALTVALTIQPGVLQGLQRHQGFRERGLLGRFLYSLPPVLLGQRQTRTRPVPESIRATYYARLTALLKLPLTLDDQGCPVSQALQLTPEARRIFEDFEAWVEPMLAPFGSLGHMTDWSGKLVGHVARVMGLLHCASTTQAPWRTKIAPETVQCALQIGTYLIAYARAAYSTMGADAALEDPKHLLAWLKREPRTTITKRDLHQGVKTRFPRIGMMEPAVQLLGEHGFLAPQAPATQDGKPGRPPGPCYDINPHLYTHNPDAQNPQNPQKGDPGGGCEDFEDFEIRNPAQHEHGAQLAHEHPEESVAQPYATNGTRPVLADDAEEIEEWTS